MIHESIAHLALPISSLLHLENNPRRGDVNAIAASYSEFGQVKPIVVRPNDDGTFTVIAGNHQMMAAKLLGWESIAAVQLESDDERAIAFALADNRTMELGQTDDSLILDMLGQINSSYASLMQELQWDDFEIAALTEHVQKFPDEEIDNGYTPPVMISFPDEPLNLMPNATTSFDEITGDTIITANEGIDTKAAATMGSTAINSSGSNKSVVQYTLVFDSPEQQREWYTFIRYLKSSPVYEGSTTAERLISFTQAHADY